MKKNIFLLAISVLFAINVFGLKRGYEPNKNWGLNL